MKWRPDVKRLAFVTALSALALFATQAAAVTVLNTTQADVKKECAGKTKCSAACGSTLCDYVCEDPKKQCTVAIFLKKPPAPKHPTASTAAGAAKAAVH